MPVANITLEEINRSILFPAYYKVIDDITKAISIEMSNRVIMNKDMNIAATDNKSNATMTEQDNLPTTVSKRKLSIDINDDYNEDDILMTSVNNINSYFIFQDSDINVYIYPIFIKTDVEIDFSYQTPSLTEAKRIRDQIRIDISRLRNILHHEIDYDILLPDIVEEFVADVYDLKSRLEPLTLEEYFRTYSTKRMHLVTDMAKPENARIAIRERQVRIVGQFDFTMPEKEEIDNETNTYKINFKYRFSFDVPRGIVMRYPVMVCNKPMLMKYIQFIADNKINSKEERKKELSYSLSLYSLSYFEAHRQLENRIDIALPINIPMVDDFSQQIMHKGYTVLYSFLVEIDETDRKGLINLRELGDYELNDELLQFIQNVDRNYIINPYMSFLYLGIQQDESLFDANYLSIDQNLNVTSQIPLNLYRPTRILLSINVDFTMLEPSVIERFYPYPNILAIVLKEQMRAILNTKHALYQTLSTNSDFYYAYVRMINNYIKIDNLDAVKLLMASIQENQDIYVGLIQVVKVNYPNIYNYLVTNNVIAPIDQSSYAGYRAPENTGMKTIQTTYIVAERRE